MTKPLKVVIVGGGTSGWMCAAALGSQGRARTPGQAALCEVRLVESAEIGTVGVGEATLPHIKEFNDYLGIDEAEFMRETKASFKLGIQFDDWGKKGNSYVHPFGAFGQPLAGVEFQHYWTRARKEGIDLSLEACSYAVQAARHMKFDFPSEDKKSIKSTYSYAYHFDAGLYAAYLRRHAEARGVKRTEGKVVGAALRPADGHIQSITLESGEVIEGDLFVDCSGFRGLLIGEQLKSPWEDWSRWLPCDRAWAVPSARVEPFTPYTWLTAREAGWQWRIPLQHRTGNGHVFSTGFISEDVARQTLLDNLDGPPLAEPRLLKFKAGRRTSSWLKNCVTIGLSSGFLEPLESTSIYLIQVAVINLMQLLPGQDMDPRLAGEFNRLTDIEYERVRDFLILHYHANTRDEALWDYTRNMSVPDSLSYKIEQFKHRGHIVKYRDGLFNPASWLAVLAGQDIVPSAYDRMADNMPVARMSQELSDLTGRIRAGVDAMPVHADFVRDYTYVAGAKALQSAAT